MVLYVGGKNEFWYISKVMMIWHHVLSHCFEVALIYSYGSRWMSECYLTPHSYVYAAKTHIWRELMLAINLYDDIKT